MKDMATTPKRVNPPNLDLDSGRIVAPNLFQNMALAMLAHARAQASTPNALKRWAQVGAIHGAREHRTLRLATHRGAGHSGLRCFLPEHNWVNALYTGGPVMPPVEFEHLLDSIERDLRGRQSRALMVIDGASSLTAEQVDRIYACGLAEFYLLLG